MPATKTFEPTPRDIVRDRDVIRARRYGNKTIGNYVIDRVGDVQVGPDTFSAYAHREHGAGANDPSASKYMTFDATTMRVIRAYR